MVFLTFVPFFLIAIVANLSERNPRTRWITYGLLMLCNLLLLFSVLLVLLMWLAFEMGEMPPEALPVQPNWMMTAIVLGLTGLLSFLPLIGGVRRFLARWLSIDPDSAVHTTALVLAVYLVGLSLMQLPLVGGLEGLEQLDAALGQSQLWQQALAQLVLALIGVGLGLRRNVRETATRLGVRWPAWPTWFGVIGLVILLQALDFGVSLAWQALAPASYEQVGRISQQLFGGFASPWGALALGVAAGLGEETLFRGALQPRFGLLLTSLLFAVIHVQYGFLSPAILVIFIIGLTFGWLRQRSGVLVCIAAHALYNVLNVLLASLWP